MEEKKPTFGSGSSGSGTKTGGKGLIFSNNSFSGDRSSGKSFDKRPERTDPSDSGKPVTRTTPSGFDKSIGGFGKSTGGFGKTTGGFDKSTAGSGKSTGGFDREPSYRKSMPEEHREPSTSERSVNGFGMIGGSRFGMLNNADRRTSKIIFSNRKNKPVISSAFFIMINGNGETRVIPVLNGMLIGRVWSNSAVPDIPLSCDADRRQGEIIMDEDKIWFCNYSQRCTIFLNDEQSTTDRFQIRFGDIIRIHGPFDLMRANDTVLILVDQVPEGMSWDRIQVEKNSNDTVQLVREDDPTKPSVQFTCQKGRFSLSHFSGLKGFTVNNRPGELNKTLNAMDVLTIEGMYFVCVANAIVCPAMWKRKTDPARRTVAVRPGGLQINIRARTVRKGLSRREALLRDIRLFIPKGSLVLVLGGSGAGKTTFINAVMGYEPADGVIKYDDIDIYREYDKMKYAIGYVQQEDLLRRTDIVEDTLKDAAKMHLSGSKEEQGVAVAETMKLLGLEKEKDKLVGSLSGGQRKRLSIGVEYVGEPLLFFLDEPDSGLDGSNADNMWDIVRKIADTGKIVMVISHIPDRAFNLFDKVIVLAKDKNNTGRLAFAGSPDEACKFFDTERLEEIVKRVNRVNEGGEGRADEFIKLFAEAGYGRE